MPEEQSKSDASFRSENAEKSPQGRVVEPKDDQERDAAVALAFDYRGDVTLELIDDRSVTGYLFNRAEEGGFAVAKMMPSDGSGDVSVPVKEIRRIRFSDRDPAAGQTWENWLKRYVDQKAAGKEAGIKSAFEKDV